MLSFIKRIRLTLEHLGESVRSNYGPGPFRYLKFIYYSFLRVNTFNIYEFKLGRELDQVPPRDDLEFREMSPSELGRYRKKNFSQEFFMDSVGTLSHCHVVFCEQEIAYIHWIYSPGEVSRFLRLSDFSAEINYIHTRAEFRRKGICSWALGKALERLEKNGLKKVLTVVHTDNIASCRAMERVGFVPVAKVRAIGPFNRRMTI